MPDDINELDVTDAGLKGIFGDRFTDETQSKPKKVVSKKETTTTTHAEKVAQKPKDEPVDAKLCPARPEPNWMDRLKACAVWAVGFSSLNFLIFSWQLQGLMDDSIAIPSMWVCCLLAGLGIGKNAFGRVR